MAKRPPRLGGELPAYTTMGATTPTTPKKPVQRMLRTLAMGKPGMGKTVQRSPRENIGTPGTSKFVQRTPANSSQRMPGGMGRVMNTLRTKLSAPRKPAK